MYRVENALKPSQVTLIQSKALYFRRTENIGVWILGQYYRTVEVFLIKDCVKYVLSRLFSYFYIKITLFLSFSLTKRPAINGFFIRFSLKILIFLK